MNERGKKERSKRERKIKRRGKNRGKILKAYGRE